MLDLVLNHSPAFVTGELALGLSLCLFGVALVGTMRDRYSVKSSSGEDKEPIPPLTAFDASGFSRGVYSLCVARRSCSPNL